MREAFARQILELAFKLDAALRTPVEFDLPAADDDLSRVPEQLRAWAVKVADGREF
jgi:hypothetical protein